MSKLTSIQIEQPTLDKLKTIKEYPRQTYNELINKMIEIYVWEKIIINMIISCIRFNN